MIKRTTVLVLGAGASIPFGFPSGWGLLVRLCRDVLRNPDTFGILNTLGFERAHITDFLEALQKSGCPSVDTFLEDRNDFMDVGKAAIALALLPIEVTSSLFDKFIEASWAQQQRIDTEGKEKDSWYQYLWGQLTEECTFDALDKNKLSVITFNYDRSLEHYLFTAMKNKYNKTDEECAKKLKQIHIVHVYGSLGLLPWQVDNNSPADSIVPYDAKVEPQTVKRAADSIQIMHESDMGSPLFDKARGLISNAYRLFFLGFGYHPTNVKRLSTQLLKEKERIKGTSMGLSFARRVQLSRLGIQNVNFRLDLPNKTVYRFLYDDVNFNES